jgi:hypothetical protein
VQVEQRKQRWHGVREVEFFFDVEGETGPAEIVASSRSLRVIVPLHSPTYVRQRLTASQIVIGSLQVPSHPASSKTFVGK